MLTLGARDLVSLHSSLQTLLSPLGYDSVDAWRLAACRGVQELLRADKAGFLLALPEHELFVGEQLDMAGFRAYGEYYCRLDVGYQERRKALGLEVNNLAMVYDMETLGATEVYNDFSRRYGFLDALAMSTDLDATSAPAAVVVYHDRESQPEFGERGVALLHLLLPALKAGATMCARHARRRAGVLEFVDGLREGCLVVDATGTVVHQTSALDVVLDGDPEHPRVRAEMRRVADRLASTVRRPGVRSDRRRTLSSVLPRTTIRTGRGTYIVSGSFIGGDALDADCLIVVTVDRREPAPLSDAELRDRYALTPRQVQVARLLEAGRTAHEIATALGTTLHTAERHTEHAMAKLGVRSRAAVSAQLRRPVPEP